MVDRLKTLLVLVATGAALAGAACTADTSGDGSSGGTAAGAGSGTTAGTTGGTAATGSATGGDYDFSAVHPVVEDLVAEYGLEGAGLIVVDAEDGVVYEDYWGTFDADRISLVASSPKMVSAGVLLHLDDQGVLDIDAPVADVAEWGSANPDITPAQLISNSSGLVGLIDNPAYPPYLCQYVAGPITLQECGEAIFTTPDDDDQVIPPDTEFRYGGGQWQVSGAVAEAASGSSWADLVDEIYVQPCELETLGYNNHFTQITGGSPFTYPTPFGGDPSSLEPTQNPNMEGGMYVTTGDYAKLLLMHLRGGRCGDTQVLSQEALDRMHADRIGEVYGGESRPGGGYGMGWWVFRDTGVIADLGAYGAFPWLDLDNGFGAYLVIEDTSETGAAMFAQIAPLVNEAIVGS